MKLLALLLITALLLPTTAYAKQMSFSRTKDADNYLFAYQWLDHNKQLQQLEFTINKKALFGKFRNFRSYKADIAQQHILYGIKKAVAKKPLENAQLRFENQDGQTIIHIVGDTPEAIESAQQQLTQLKDQVTTEHLKESFYHTFELYDQSQGIKPDHVRIANNSVVDLKPLKPILLSKFSIKNIRNATNYTLGFVQNIPYATLESRLSSSGAGFNPPLKLLYENQGDCDSKVTLTAALLRSLMPRVKMVMIFLDQHALIGVNVKPEGDDIFINHQGEIYVLAEPTGPQLLTLGNLAPTSELAILNGHYSVENYHALAPQTPLNSETTEQVEGTRQQKESMQQP
ncbi:hypothetical protein [Thalassotalea sp. PLHSN55]|uniref:hypothetical protein n=1 Tax=Thalassotalea sp. PLHSN55 TaxID=3435888 RepID=UPI003F841AE6